MATRSTVDTQRVKLPMLSTWTQAALILLVVTAVYFQTWIDIWPYWANKNATYTHGTLVALAALWLVWRARPAVNTIPPAPSLRSILLVALLSAAWLVAEKANIFIVYAMLWPILAFSALWAGLGFNVASRFAFPLSFLYFAIPCWDYLKPLLQVITSYMAELITRALGIPAAFDGPYVTLPTGTIFIAEDCSGAHFLAVALAVGSLAVALRNDSARTHIAIIAVAGALSMMFNWLRIVMIVLAYQHPDLKHALEAIGHLTFGWWVFAIDLLVFGSLLHFIPSADRSEPQLSQSKPIALTTHSNNQGIWCTAGALVLLPAAAWVLPQLHTPHSKGHSTALEETFHKHEILTPDMRWQPQFRGATTEARFAVQDVNGALTEVYWNKYNAQSHGAELISSDSRLFDPATFTKVSTTIVSFLSEEGTSTMARREILRDNSGSLWLAIYAYLVDGDGFVGPRRVQMVAAIRSLYSRPIAGIVAATAKCETDCESSDPTVESAFALAFETNTREARQ